MHNSKDYYKILGVNHSSSLADIKKSYRKLALQYHPDTNSGSQLFEAKFKEITEAYKVLSNEKLRRKYNHSRSWLSKNEKGNADTRRTPQIILNEIIDLKRKVASLDPHRINPVAVSQRIQQLLSRANINMLKQNADEKLNKRIIEEIIICSRFLSFEDAETICLQLTELAGTDNESYRKIYRFLKEVKMQTTWNKYKIFVAVLVAIIFCFAIYFISTTI